MEFIRRTAG